MWSCLNMILCMIVVPGSDHETIVSTGQSHGRPEEVRYHLEEERLRERDHDQGPILPVMLQKTVMKEEPVPHSQSNTASTEQTGDQGSSHHRGDRVATSNGTTSFRWPGIEAIMEAYQQHLQGRSLFTRGYQQHLQGGSLFMGACQQHLHGGSLFMGWGISTFTRWVTFHGETYQQHLQGGLHFMGRPTNNIYKVGHISWGDLPTTFTRWVTFHGETYQQHLQGGLHFMGMGDLPTTLTRCVTFHGDHFAHRREAKAVHRETIVWKY